MIDRIIHASGDFIPPGQYRIYDAGLHVDGSRAIVLDTPGGERVAKVSVCMASEGVVPPPGLVYVKTWSENAGLIPSLIEAGALEDTGHRRNLGPYRVSAWLCKVCDRPKIG